MKNSYCVYSTDTGRQCPECGRPSSQCICKKTGKMLRHDGPFPEDGVVRIRRETQGRKGKTVTAVYGLASVETNLAPIVRTLKQCCGTGGTIKDRVVFIQGDHRQTLQTELKNLGYTVKLAGG